MSFIKLNRAYLENVSFKLNPHVTFVSSSKEGVITGSENISPVQTDCLKQPDNHNPLKVIENFKEDGSIIPFDESAMSLEGYNNVLKAFFPSDNNIESKIKDYMDYVNTLPLLDSYGKKINIYRFDPPFKQGINTIVKRNIQNILMPHYKHRYTDCEFIYSNYNTLNFYTASNIPNNAALIYPNSGSTYHFKNEFTLDFWINPRYGSDKDSNFHAGTIFHLSSSIAASLISGSTKDEYGKTNKFKIMVQLSHSADIDPSKVNFNSISYPNDLIFTSSFELKRNHWHHVSIGWGSKNVNNFTGSILIDDNTSEFNIYSQSISPIAANSPDALIIGNYFKGAESNLKYFFNNAAAQENGIMTMVGSGGDPASSLFDFSHPLNAEVHEIKFYDKYHTPEEKKKTRTSGVKDYDNLLFYLPPFFYPEARKRSILITPVKKETNVITQTPINADFSLGVGGKLINLENFTREYISQNTPRLFNMTASLRTLSTTNLTADDHVYGLGNIIKRNQTILPNDNGQFMPDYFVLNNQVSSSMYNRYKYNSGSSEVDFSNINLENLVDKKKIHNNGFGSLPFDALLLGHGQKPEDASNLIIEESEKLTLADRLKDLSSNDVVIFDISSLFYGNRIKPETFKLIDTNLTGSSGKVKITLSDDGKGGIYRSDGLTKHAKWSTVGNVFYDEGLAIVKSPHLFYYSKDRTEVLFDGDFNVHSMIINIPISANQINSSSNPAFISTPPTENINDTHLESMLISSVNIHDDNFNIVMKAHLAQPIIKTEEDSFMIRIKKDF